MNIGPIAAEYPVLPAGVAVLACTADVGYGVLVSDMWLSSLPWPV